MSENDETENIRKLAIVHIGEDARPTCVLRILASPSSGRLQQQWEGTFGTIWLDVPHYEIDVLPMRGKLTADAKSSGKILTSYALDGTIIEAEID